MNIAVIPPEIRQIDSVNWPHLPEADTVYCGDLFFQKDKAAFFWGKDTVILGIDDLGGDSIFKEVNCYAKRFAREWYLLDGIAGKCEFKGVNLFSQLVIAYTFYFLRVLKAVDAALAILQKFHSYRITIIDDNDVWSRTFRFVAAEKNVQLTLVQKEATSGSGGARTGVTGQSDCGGEHGTERCPVEKRQLSKKNDSLKGKLSLLNRFHLRNRVNGSVLYSAALRFIKPLWESSDSGENIYYLRPDFSVKDYFACATSRSKVKYVTVRSLISEKDEKASDAWCDINDVASLLKGFKGEENDFFLYKGLNLWGLIRQDLCRMMEGSVREGAKRVAFFEKLFERINPSVVIVEEDTCPFNRLLVEFANNRKIPTIQILHGLLTNDVMSDRINSSKVVLPGAYSEQRLLEWGVDDGKMIIAGAPHYEASIKRLDTVRARKYWRAKTGASEKDLLVTLVTQPFFDEKNPYFIGNPLTPENTVKILRTAVELVRRDPNLKMVVKLHPMDDKSWLIRDEIKRHPCRDRMFIVDKCDTLGLVAASDLVLSGGSTVYLEALLLNVPVLIFDDHARRFWDKLKSEYMDINDTEASVNKALGLLGDPLGAKKRLLAQKAELSWHFVKNNINVMDHFNETFFDLRARITGVST